MRQPPRILNWLLNATGVTRRNEALAGDLAEEYAAGRSVLWYCWQTLAAIVSHIYAEIESNRLLALWAIFMGFTLPFAIGWAWSAVVAGIVGGWHGPYVVVLMSPWRHSFVIFLATGWIIARAHRGRSLPMIVAVAATRTLWLLVQMCIGFAWYIPMLGFVIGYTALSVASMLLGGLLGATDERTRQKARE